MATTKATLLAHRSATSFSDLTLSGDLTVSGTTTTIDTEVVVSDATVINNAGSDVGLKINSTSSSHIMQLQDNGTDIIKVKDGGEVYISSFVGMIAPFGISTTPAGWLYCNGATLGKASSGATNASDDYEALFDLIKNLWGNSGGTFSAGNTISLPNLQAAFLRGIDANTGHQMANGNNFSGPTTLGTFENDLMQNHKHGLDWYNGNANADFYNNYLAKAASNGSGIGNATASFTNTAVIGGPATNTAGTPRTGDETRPFNAGVKFCIKF